MILSVKLEDFLSHRRTQLDLGSGVIVFVGHNGAGKSSVIDAITFALFEKHNRGVNANLIRYGASRASITVDIEVRGRIFRISRTLIPMTRQHLAELYEIKNGTLVRVSSGSRNVKDYLSRLLGITPDELLIAGIVRQGELESIINLRPAEARKLIDRLVGLEHFEEAYTLLHQAIERLRRRWSSILGLEPSPITASRLKNEALILENRAKSEIKEADEISKRLESLENRLREYESKLELLRVKKLKLEELRNYEKSLRDIVSQLITQYSKQVSQLVTIIKEKRKVLETVRNAKRKIQELSDVERELPQIQKELETVRNRVEELISRSGELQGLLKCAEELKPRNGRCPLCGSRLPEGVKEFPLARSYEEELRCIEEELRKARSYESSLRRKFDELQQKFNEYKYWARVLENVGVDENKLELELRSLESELSTLRSKLDTLKRLATGNLHNIDLDALDQSIRAMIERILSLRHELRDFSEQELVQLERVVEKLRKEVNDLRTREKSLRKLAEDHLRMAENYRKLATKMEKVIKAISKVEELREKVFAKHSKVLTALRQRVLREISRRASEYLRAFDLPVFGIDIIDEPRTGGLEIRTITESGVRDVRTLSGGERVAVALAIRLGIAHVISRGKLDFIILDEPTTHLDYDRRRALLRIITQAFRKGIGPLRQIIVITHDEELLEEAEVDKIYRFRLTSEGTKVEAVTR